MSTSWNIKKAAEQLYKFEFELDMNDVIDFDKTETAGFLYKVEKVNDTLFSNDVEFTTKDLLSIESAVHTFYWNMKDPGAKLVSYIYIQRYCKTDYKEAYEVQKSYNNQIEAARRGEGVFPDSRSKEFELVEKINKQQDQFILSTIKSRLKEAFMTAVIDKLGEGQLSKSGIDDYDGSVHYLFEGKNLKFIFNIFERLNNIKNSNFNF